MFKFIRGLAIATIWDKNGGFLGEITEPVQAVSEGSLQIILAASCYLGYLAISYISSVFSFMGELWEKSGWLICLIFMACAAVASAAAAAAKMKHNGNASASSKVPCICAAFTFMVNLLVPLSAVLAVYVISPLIDRFNSSNLPILLQLIIALSFLFLPYVLNYLILAPLFVCSEMLGKYGEGVAMRGTFRISVASSCLLLAFSYGTNRLSFIVLLIVTVSSIFAVRNVRKRLFTPKKEKIQA